MPNAPLLLRAYLTLSAIDAPLFAWVQRRRIKAGKEDSARQSERWGKTNTPRPNGPLVWFHAASVGETLSLQGVIAQILAEDPHVHVLVTSGTVTSAALMAQHLPPRAIHQFVPFDCKGAVAAFLDHWQPDCAIWTESELWPRLLFETQRRGIPMALVNARVSQKTAGLWRKWPRTARAVLAHFTQILAQDSATQTVMTEIGIEPGKVIFTGSLKEDLAPLHVIPEDLARLRAEIGARAIWVAASTHPTEDEILIEAHQTLGLPNALLILVPRHPERGDAIAQMVSDRAISFVRRSAAQSPKATTSLYLADTMGELGLWYRLAQVCFIGGSLAPVGGHNPYEPALLDCPIVTGPHVFNFSEIYDRLGAADAVVTASTAPEIRDAIFEYLSNVQLRETRAANARSAIETTGATDRVVALVSYLYQSNAAKRA